MVPGLVDSNTRRAPGVPGKEKPRKCYQHSGAVAGSTSINVS
ncbi:hypothetical protein CBM2598_U70011 [Cupriavidus taiwanensis]|nr:hypothetical protein CBM2598_U70011 [Cupriavidus taiwanensis]